MWLDSHIRRHRAIKAFSIGFALLAGGAIMMLAARSSTAQEADGAVQAVHTLRVGDVVELNVWNEPELTVRAEVGREGAIVFPLVGRVDAAGVAPSDLEDLVERKYGDGYLVDPQVYITVLQRRNSRVYVIGAVQQPGVYDLNEGTTMLELLAHCGGATEEAQSTVLIIRHDRKEAPAEAESEAVPGGEAKLMATRQPKVRLLVDLSKLLSGDLSDNVILQDRDIVLFPNIRQNQAHIYILGDVEPRGPYPLAEDMALSALLASIGLNPQDETCTVTVVRLSETDVQKWEFKATDVFEGKAGEDFALRDGDVLTVNRPQEVYYVIGQVNGPGAFRYQKGITVREAIVVAGWVTTRGNLKNIIVMRKVAGEFEERRIDLDDKIQPGDVIKVKEKWF